MATWKPADTIHSGEIIGRRIFDKKPLDLSDINAVPSNIFFDSRLADDLSFDRLGAGQPHKPTVTYLTPMCDQAATGQEQLFLGWFATQKKNVKFEDVRPDILTTERDGVENPYHALLDRSAARQKAQAFHLSRSLLMAFKENGQVVAPIRKTSAKPESAVET